jgi:hypothetical protein
MAEGKRSILVQFLGDSKVLKGASKEAENAVMSLEERTKHFGKTLASAYAAKEVIEFGKSAVEAAVKEQAEQAILAKTLANTTGATREQTKAAEEWIAKTALQTGVAKDQLTPALETMTVATKDVAKAQDLVGLSMDVARGKGIDLETATKAIAKAYAGNSTALNKLVPGLKEAGEKTLTFAEAKDRLNHMFGGQAASWANTDEGKMARISAQYKEMQQQIGGALLPVLSKLVGVVSSVFNWFESLNGAQQKIIIGVGLAAAAVYVGVAAFNALSVATAALGVSLEVAVPWLAPLAAGLGALIAVLGIFGGGESDAERNAREFGDAIRTSTALMDLHKVALDDATTATKNFSNATYAGVDKTLRDAVAGNKDYIDGLQKLGLTIDDIMAANRGGAAAEDLVTTARRKAVETNQVWISGIENGPPLLASLTSGNNALRESTERYIATGETQNEGFKVRANSVTTLIDLLEKQSAASSQSLLDSVELAKLGDTQSIVYLKTTGHLNLLTEAEQRSAEAALAKAAADAAAAAAADKDTAAVVKATVAHAGQKSVIESVSAAERENRGTKAAITAASTAATLAVQSETKAHLALLDAIKALQERELESVDATYALEAANRRAIQAAKDANETAKDSKKSEIEKKDAIEAGRQAAEAAAVQYAEVNKNNTEGKSKIDLMIASLTMQASQLNGPMKDALLWYIGTLKNIPKNLDTRIGMTIVGTTGHVRGSVDPVTGQINSLSGRPSRTAGATAGTGGSLGGLLGSGQAGVWISPTSGVAGSATSDADAAKNAYEQGRMSYDEYHKVVMQGYDDTVKATGINSNEAAQYYQMLHQLEAEHQADIEATAAAEAKIADDKKAAAEAAVGAAEAAGQRQRDLQAANEKLWNDTIAMNAEKDKARKQALKDQVAADEIAQAQAEAALAAGGSSGAGYDKSLGALLQQLIQLTGDQTGKLTQYLSTVPTAAKVDVKFVVNGQDFTTLVRAVTIEQQRIQRSAT